HYRRDLAVLQFFSVAVHALIWRVLVNHDLFLSNRARLRMAFATRDVRMSPRQRQVGLRVVVKCGWHPALCVMAVRTVCLIVLGQELAIVSILVACLALLRRPLEPRFVSRRGLMTLSARHRAVGSQQRELCFRMVEPVDVSPGLHVMAS